MTTTAPICSVSVLLLLAGGCAGPKPPAADGSDAVTTADEVVAAPASVPAESDGAVALRFGWRAGMKIGVVKTTVSEEKGEVGVGYQLTTRAVEGGLQVDTGGFGLIGPQETGAQAEGRAKAEAALKQMTVPSFVVAQDGTFARLVEPQKYIDAFIANMVAQSGDAEMGVALAKQMTVESISRSVQEEWHFDGGTWAGKQLADWLGTSDSYNEEWPDSLPLVVKDLSGRFPFASMRLKYLQSMLAWYRFADKF